MVNQLYLIVSHKRLACADSWVRITEEIAVHEHVGYNNLSLGWISKYIRFPVHIIGYVEYN